MAIKGHRIKDELFRSVAFAKYLCILLNRGPDFVQVNPRPLTGVLGVIERGLVRQQSHARVAGARQLVEFAVRVDVVKVGRDFIFAAMTQSVKKQGTIVTNGTQKNA